MIYVLNGPNLGRLGLREPGVYGSATYQDLVEMCRAAAGELGLTVEVRQTNAEHEMLQWLYQAADEGADVVLNPGAWTHYNYAVRDACAMLRGKLVEVHISNVHKREAFRHHSYVSLRADGVIAGLGTLGYQLALRRIAQLIGPA